MSRRSLNSTVPHLPRMAASMALILAVVLGAAGCGEATGAFHDSGGRPDCRIHQAAMPDKDYTGVTTADTQAILAMLRYLTAHRAQAYCDGRPASSTDRAWSMLYQRFTEAQS